MAKYSLQEEPPFRRPLALSAFLRGRNGNGKWGNGREQLFVSFVPIDISPVDVRRADVRRVHSRCGVVCFICAERNGEWEMGESLCGASLVFVFLGVV